MDQVGWDLNRKTERLGGRFLLRLVMERVSIEKLVCADRLSFLWNERENSRGRFRKLVDQRIHLSQRLTRWDDDGGGMGTTCRMGGRCVY